MVSSDQGMDQVIGIILGFPLVVVHSNKYTSGMLSGTS